MFERAEVHPDSDAAYLARQAEAERRNLLTRLSLAFGSPTEAVERILESEREAIEMWLW